jgi:hypothetical protein
MRNHPIFRPVDDEQDSCIVALYHADERFRRLRSERKDEEPTEPSRYQASDDDLPSIFFERGSR